MIKIFHELSTAALREIAISLREGTLATGTSANVLRNIAGPEKIDDLFSSLYLLKENGWTAKQIAEIADAISNARNQVASPESLFDLVISGPNISGVPTRDTSVVMQDLMEQAQKEVIIIGYAFHNCKKIFSRIAKKKKENPELDIWFCVNIQRSLGDTSLSSDIIRRFSEEFKRKYWPWDHKPRVYYYSKSLEELQSSRASLHSKCLIIDRQKALITSANFTEAAQERNIETGVIVSYKPFIDRLVSYFIAMKGCGHLEECY